MDTTQRTSRTPTSAHVDASDMRQHPDDGRMRLRVAAIGVTLVCIAIVSIAAWYLFIRDDAPPPVSMDSALSDTSDLPTGGSGASGGTETNGTAGSTDGSWVLATDSESFVGYRVAEELAGIGATEAVGRTSAITASVTLNGSQVRTASISVDMTQLQSDSDRRDGALERQALETGAFPEASFELTAPLDLGTPPVEGETYAVTATGDLTLHGVTRAITIPLEARFSDGYLIVIGTTEIVFADYDIDEPQSQALLGVEDHGTLELQLILAPQT